MKFLAAEWRHRAAELFGIDLRSLALFRVGLASMLIYYVLNRLPDIGAFYTDWGVLPRSFLVQFDGWSRISLYFANGDWWFAALLLAVTLACAIGLWLGYRTRLMSVLLFVLFTSLINRNPLILIGGDGLLACLLFWAMFVPLGARWSVDAAFATQPPPEQNLHASWGSAGLLLQVLSVYFFTAWLKVGSDWWPDGTAVYYTMQLERYTSPLGQHLLGRFPTAMHWLSYYVWFVEWIGPLLVFVPWFRRPLRFAVLLGLGALHVGFLLFMKIGYFPYVSLISLTVLVGGWIWDALARRNERRHPNGPRIYYDRDCGFCLNTCRLFQHFLVLPRARIGPAQDSQRAKALLEANYSWVVIDTDDRAYLKWPAFVILLKHSPVFGWLYPLLKWTFWERLGNPAYDFVGRHRPAFGALTAPLTRERDVAFVAGRGVQRIAAAFTVLVLLWNLVTVRAVPDGFMLVTSPVMRLLRLDQMWNMFAPTPSHRDGWSVYPGKLEDGTEVDVLRPGRPLSWDRPAVLADTYENIAWHTLRWRLTDKEFAGYRLYYGKYLCRQWNWTAPPGRRLATFDIANLEEITPPPGQPATPVERRVYWQHDCRPQDAEREKQERREERKDPMEPERQRPVL